MASGPLPVGPGGFSVAVTETDEQVVLVATGELDILTAPVLDRHLSAAVARHPQRIVVDLGAVTFLDVRGVNVLVKADAAASAAGSALVLRSPMPNLRRMLELCGVEHLSTDGG